MLVDMGPKVKARTQTQATMVWDVDVIKTPQAPQVLGSGPERVFCLSCANICNWKSGNDRTVITGGTLTGKPYPHSGPQRAESGPAA